MSAAVCILGNTLKLHKEIWNLCHGQEANLVFAVGRAFPVDLLQFSSLSTAVTPEALEMQPNFSRALGCTNKISFTVVLAQQGEIWKYQ